MHASSASSASARPDSSNFLAGLTNRVPEANLRQFLSDLPPRYLRNRLTQIAPSITRDEFLNQLQPDSVNQILDTMSERDMKNFVLNVVPSDIKDTIFAASPAAMAYFTASSETSRIHRVN